MERVLSALPATASAVAEGAWVFVVYAAIQLWPAEVPLHLEPWMFMAAAALGIAVARRLRGRPGVAARIALVLGCGAVGWLAAPAVVRLVSVGTPGTAVARHAGGWLLGLAAWRGARHDDAPSDDRVVGRLLAVMIPGLTVPWLLGTAGAARATFAGAALPATLLFVGAGLVAGGVTRLDALSRAAGLDWRRNRTWLGLLVAVVSLIVVVDVPFAFALGSTIGELLAIVAAPVAALAPAIIALLEPLVGATHGLGPVRVPSMPLLPAGPSLPGAPDWLGNALAVLLVVPFAAGAILIWRRVRGAPAARIWMPSGERRRFELPALTLDLPRLRLPGIGIWRRPVPDGASAAYVWLLERLESDDRLRRRPAEGPAAHAARLRRTLGGAFALDLLAADFGLEQYAGATLSDRETARARRRAHAARHQLGREAP